MFSYNYNRKLAAPMIKVIYQLFDAQKLLPLTKQSQNTKLSIFLEIFRFCNLERDLKSDFRSIEKSCITKYSYFIHFNFFRTVKLVSCALKRTLSLEQNCNKHCTKSWNIRKMQIISMENFPISCKASFFFGDALRSFTVWTRISNTDRKQKS